MFLARDASGRSWAAMARVLVTGMSGLIGGALRARLAAAHELRALNRGRVDGVPCHQADIADLEAIRPAFDGVDVVVHLAANAHGSAPWADVLQHNVVGTYNVFEAARLAGVKRVIYASSGATVSNCERDFPYSALVSGRYDEVATLADLDPRVAAPAPVASTARARSGARPSPATMPTRTACP